MFLDRVFHECQSQARACSSFGRKEGLGYFGQVLRCYPTAIVRKGHPQSVSASSPVHSECPGHSDVHPAPCRRRMSSIQQEIGEHLTQ